MGLRQEDLAVTLGVTRQTINAIENNKYNPSLELAMKLAKLLHIPVKRFSPLKNRGQSVGFCRTGTF
jgi:putative transcriptional regulator